MFRDDDDVIIGKVFMQVKFCCKLVSFCRKLVSFCRKLVSFCRKLVSFCRIYTHYMLYIILTRFLRFSLNLDQTDK